jgi:hypothetical protein
MRDARCGSIAARTALLWLVTCTVAAAQTAPEVFLGHAVGADRTLADYGQIETYLRKLAQESPRVRVVDIGTTTLKKPMIMAVITAERNMSRLDRYREIARQLRDARGLTPQTAANLAREGKVILAIGCNIHSTEIGSSQMAMELAYKLATGRTPFDVDQVLNDVIVLLIPSVNPDGQQMVTDWYRKYVGTPFEGGRMPWLYHHYAGHDDNRDFYMFNLPETRAVGKVLYHDWLPQIFIDEHQMGSNGARLFVSPYNDPTLPDVHPLVWRSIALMGANMMFDLERAGLRGVVTGEGYTGWWTGGEDEVSWPHNIIAFLTEAASAKVASPIYIEPNELGRQFTQRRMQFPNPWPGGWWRLRDIIDYELTFNFSAIKTAFQRKEDLLTAFYQMNAQSITAEPREGAFVISARQHDPLTMYKLLDVLALGGLELHQAEEAFEADGIAYPAGSFVVRLDQPYRPYAMTLLARQKYPDMRQYDAGPPIAPYDNAAWTLPMLMGVDTRLTDKPITARLKRISDIPYPAATIAQGRSARVVLDGSLNASFAMALAVLRAGGGVARTKTPLQLGGRSLPSGSFVVENSAAVEKALPDLARKWRVSPVPLESTRQVDVVPVTNPRIGLYQSYQSSMDEGWTRYLLDDLQIPFVTLKNNDMREPGPAGLLGRVDVLILASEDPEVIINGRRPGPAGERAQGDMPPEYEGGIGKSGVEAIKTFVANGGVLITLSEACRFAFRELGAPASDAVQGLDRTKFFLPSSIVRIDVNPESPLAYGMPSKAAAMFANSVVMDTWLPAGGDLERQVVARYAAEDILLSGWLIGGERMSGKVAVLDVRLGKGRIAMIGFRPQYRGQSHGTYKFLLNALLYPQRSAAAVTSDRADRK